MRSVPAPADPAPSTPYTPQCVSIIVPVRNEAGRIGALVARALAQRDPRYEVEVIVADDGSEDGTPEVAEAAGARVLRLEPSGNPAIGRNRGAAAAKGDLLVFLDADCEPAPGWLAALVAAHRGGEVVVGGALELPPDLGLSARCDYYCGWYHVHARRPAGYVVNHPPGNLSVRRELFLATQGFVERQPVAFAHEELAWQAELGARGYRIYFEPGAVVLHRNRPGFGNLFRRNYRWAYSAIESKASSRAARMAWIYRHPRALMLAAPALAPAQALYVIGCWIQARRLEPLLLAPVVFAARIAYSAGLIAGGARWLRERAAGSAGEYRPRWE